MSKSIWYVVTMAVIFMACSKSEVETPNGFTYKVVKDEEGDKAKPGQFVVFEYRIKDSKDSVWLDSKVEGFPGAYQVQDSAAINSEIGMQQLFRLVSVSDSIHIEKPAKEFFKQVMGSPAPPTLDTTTMMICDLRVVNILDRDKFPEYQQGLMKEKLARQKTIDADLISSYVKEKNINAIQDTSGIAYVVHTSGGKQKPSVDNCVEVSYVGKFLSNGEIFDQNPRLTFPLGQVIKGWQIGIPMLGVGDSATFFIPSGLAYGPRPRRTIPANSVLVFDVKLLGVKEFDPATGACK